MHSNTQAWVSLSNMLLLVIWLRIWTYEDRFLFFNPYLATLTRVSSSILKALRPLFFGAPPRLIPAMAVMLIIILRAIILTYKAPIVIIAGFEVGMPIASSILSCLLFSTLSFLVPLFMVWSIALIYIRPGLHSPSNHTANAIACIARPFTDIKPDFRPPALLLLGLIIVTGTALGGEPMDGCMMDGGITPIIMAKFATSALAFFANILFYIRAFTIILIIGSLVSAFTGSQNLMTFCQEWLNFFMGPLRRYPIRIGMFDLTPLLFIIGLNFVHSNTLAILREIYSRIQ